MFQPNTWYDEQVMKEWILSEWINPYTSTHDPGSSGKLLVADVHRAQQTEAIKCMLKKKKTVLSNVPLVAHLASNRSMCLLINYRHQIKEN